MGYLAAAGGAHPPPPPVSLPLRGSRRPGARAGRYDPGEPAQQVRVLFVRPRWRRGSFVRATRGRAAAPPAGPRRGCHGGSDGGGSTHGRAPRRGRGSPIRSSRLLPGIFPVRRRWSARPRAGGDESRPCHCLGVGRSWVSGSAAWSGS